MIELPVLFYTKKNYIIDTFISHRLLNPIKILKSLYFPKKLTFIQTRYGQNQHLWRHPEDMMSLENRGVFLFLKEVVFEDF